ncbi:MAG TPA: ABC transporter ATP-binding protein [Hyphomicrobiaceae bacterium]
MPHDLIDVRSLSLARGSRMVLENLTFSVRRGDQVAVLGPSGIGKSTLLQIIAGLIAPSRGSVVIGGRPVKGPLPSVTMMLQRPALLPWATVLDNVLLGLRFSGAVRRDAAAAKARAMGLLERVGLDDRADAKPAELSGGEQQRVALARALAPNPAVLLLDEPFSALDPTTRKALRSDVAALARSSGVTLLLVTHDVADAAALCRRVIRLGGSPAGIISDETDIHASLELAQPGAAVLPAA